MLQYQSMKYLLYGLLAIGLYLAWFGVRFWWVLHHSTNPLIVQTDREFNTLSPTTLRYAAAGDSTVQGTGASRVETTYPYRLAEYWAQSNHVVYKNMGVSGARLNDVVTKQLPQIIAFQPDVVTISIGGNDIDRLASFAQVLNGYKTIIAELTAKTTATIYLANLPNFSGAKLLPGWYVRLIEKRSEPMNAAIAGLASDRVKIVDVHNFDGRAIPDVAATYSSDWFHPNDLGYENWTTAFLTQIERH